MVSEVDGKLQSLGKSKAVAFAKYKRLLSQSAAAVALQVREIVKRYYRHIKNELAESTVERRRGVLESFANSVPRTLTAPKLTPAHVWDWINS